MQPNPVGPLTSTSIVTVVAEAQARVPASASGASAGMA